MKEYIERELAIRQLEFMLNLVKECPDEGLMKEAIVTARQDGISIIKILPTADVAPVVHGKWNVGSIGIHCYCECSICKQETPAGMETKFCPNCGAKMDRGNTNG